MLEGRKSKSKYCFLDGNYIVHSLDINAITTDSIKLIRIKISLIFKPKSILNIPRKCNCYICDLYVKHPLLWVEPLQKMAAVNTSLVKCGRGFFFFWRPKLIQYPTLNNELYIQCLCKTWRTIQFCWDVQIGAEELHIYANATSLDVLKFQ